MWSPGWTTTAVDARARNRDARVDSGAGSVGALNPWPIVAGGRVPEQGSQRAR